MIIRPRPNLFQLFFIIRGSIVLRIIPLILLIALLSGLVVRAHELRPNWLPNFDSAPFALLGITLSIFLAFRNNASYDRWWEGRRHWGELISSARNFARQTLVIKDIQGDLQGSRNQLIFLTIAYAHSLVAHLRPSVSDAKFMQYLSPELKQKYLASRNPPEVILSEMEQILVQLKAAKIIDDVMFKVFDATISQFSLMQSSCERIINTPIPFGYTLLLHRTAYIFCFLMPFGFANTLGWATPFATALAAYTFFGLDALSNELEQPFGNLPNHLPIEALAQTIEINLREAMGETPLPALPEPEDYILM